ncbi:SRPBCC domain-containing protein [Nonomuraea typhae]|uniref:SRPBCC domain-containing protein n=1 Tax=Nonomuraea typhae TaxID=2603600 RepID=A0ABW7Z371_9ACTN
MTDDLTALHLDHFYPHPPAKVWRVLTDPELMARWLMPNDFKLEVGHAFTFTTDPLPRFGFDGVVHCRVLEIEHQKLLKISWTDRKTADWTVSWRLEGEGRGTRVFLDHEGFDPDDPVQQHSRRVMGGGWRSRHFATLERLLAELP